METYEPLDTMIKDDPVCLAQYAKDHGLLETQGWKKLKRIATNHPRLERMVHQLNLSIHKASKGPIFQFGIQVPRNVKEAYELDKKNGNNNWADAMKAEIDSLNEFNTFKDKGKIPYLDGHKNIIVHFVFAVKHDLRHKARLVAGGHLTDPSTEGTYSGVVSLRSMRIALTVAELNKLDIMVGDVSSAYLEAYTQEKVCFKAGPEFGELEGHLLVIERALYGLRTSGARWHDRFADTLREMGYFPCKADPDVWIKDANTHYEYVCVYVDDIMAIGTHPQDFFNDLTDKYNYKLKGVGPPSYHLGGDFFRDPDGTLAWGASSYAKKMLINYETMFGVKPKEYSSPMEEKDHPELDHSAELDAVGIKQYQSLIGALQWLVTLGRFDILLGVTTMSSYRAAPRIGHLERLKRMYGYIKKNPDGAIRFRVKRSQTMKVKAHLLNLIGHRLLMAILLKNFRLTCPFPRAKLCASQHTKMPTYTMIWSLDVQCLVSSTFSTKPLYPGLQRNKMSLKLLLMVLNSWLHARLLSRSWIFAIPYV